MKKAFGAPGGGFAEDVMRGKEKACVREVKSKENGVWETREFSDISILPKEQV